jgi:Nucleoside-diphosphate-sugar pyrophosphorylase involved in lipopolysaccharide biosynthesis/translation initiation factor 2B, gamma/epsilon subunits (eIF-2Bgamma/eIF-2Bepsilon)
MNEVASVSGGIIAAGSGSRLRQAGWSIPKLMVPVAGVPLIEHVIGNFLACGIRPITVIINDEARPCKDWLDARFTELDLRIIIKTTASSLESFLEVTAHLQGPRALVSTTDAWCPREAFMHFVKAACSFPVHATVLAVTPFVEDEHPLWVSADASGRVTALGGTSGELVTAGMYLVPERVQRLSPPPELKRLREWLAWLLKRGETVYSVSLPIVVDVDRAQDLSLAERLARSICKEGEA